MDSEAISHPTVGAEAFCRASGVRYASLMVEQSALLTKLPLWQRQSRDPCVLAKTLQLQFTAAGCSDLRRVASWRRLACCTGRVSRERDHQRGPRRGCRMVAWSEPALGHIEEIG